MWNIAQKIKGSGMYWQGIADCSDIEDDQRSERMIAYGHERAPENS